jgi:hypothetical protein
LDGRTPRKEDIGMGEVVSMQDGLFKKIYKLLDQMEETVGRIETTLLEEGMIEPEESSPALKGNKAVQKKIKT